MAAIETPCIRVCIVHPTLRVCVGCGRTLDEIGRWIAMTEAERARIMADLPQRCAAIGMTPAAPAVARG